ncbi:ABC transporter substrate-binding protein [Siccirubricoccus sp. KC 17139]|uniref:ABC transporter substrate-binding protein n=1 Tax=Siccirubricoccus soli TaxID=2899147 RepID=A0ABT1DAT9_9PROT|nr:ABC transporter substrate-binding protein [Siccirubricoccus soli]MCO6419041.1 ABC transporter substrate-binding protein [Siccirubricoccus soli]MCP2685176.1 ABC transporter substrate-binding protein [Siccirubricoccus soli]
MKISRRDLALGAAMLAMPGVLRAQSAPIKLGFTAALTGPFNEFGEGINRGAQIAVEECNKAGGISGRMVELAEVLDDQLVPDRAVQNLRRILDNREIVGLMCPSGSGPTLAIADMIQADGRPIINPQAQTPSIVYPNGSDKPPRPNLFSISIGNVVESEKLAAALSEFSRIGVLHESTGYGVTGADLVRKEIQRRNPRARVTVESYNQRAQDMTAQLVRVQRANAEAMLVIGLGADFAVIRRNMSRLNMNPALYGSTGAVTVPYIEGAGDLAAGTRAVNHAAFGRRPMHAAAQKFADLYRAKFGTDRWYGTDAANPLISLAGTVASGYDCINLLLDAIRRAGSTSAPDMVKALDQTTDYEGATIRRISFTPQNHVALKLEDLGMYEMQRRDGRVVLELRD